MRVYENPAAHVVHFESTGRDVPVLTLLAWRGAIKLETLGLRRSGRAASAIAKEYMGLPKSLSKARTLEQRIASATVVAPFAGTLPRGDLEQRIGQTFPLGEPLFEIAPSDQASALRIQVPEEHALELREGAEIRFSSNARPEEELRFTVQSIAPAAEVADTVNSFTVVAVPSSETSIHELRAGMEGLCDVSLGERSVWRSALDPLIRWSNQNLWW